MKLAFNIIYSTLVFLLVFETVRLAAQMPPRPKPVAVVQKPVVRPEPDRLLFLAEVETGDKRHPEGDDLRVGPDGERGRYQTTRDVWKSVSTLPYAMATNPATAFVVARTVMQRRVGSFVNHYGRQPTDAEWYLLYHRPARVFHPLPVEARRAADFANLCRPDGK